MPKALISYNNFARAKIDHDMSGRFDLPIYQSAADIFENFISNLKGNAIYRSGFQSRLQFQDCVLQEFKFNNQQNYILVFYANKIRFLSYDISGNFGWVESSPSVPLEVSTPYTLAECAELDFTQNADVMVVTHKNYPPYKLIRTSATSFTFLTFSRKFNPFGITFAATKVITGITQANPAVVTVAAHGYATGDMVKFAGVVGMTQINDYTARVTVLTANTFSVDIDTTLFTAYSSGGTVAKELTGDYPSCCLFYKGRLYYAATTLKPTTVFGSVSAIYDDFTQTPITDSSAVIFALADIAQRIESLFGGDNSLIAFATDGVVAINGGDVGKTITAANVTGTITSAEPANSVYPLRKDGLIFYVGKEARNIYYFSYDLLTESFLSANANVLSYDITKGLISKIRYKKDRNDLVYALTADGDMLTMNFNKQENIIGWHKHVTNGTFEDIVVITDNNGKPQLFSLVKRNGVFYIESQSEYVEFSSRDDFYTDGNNDTAVSREKSDNDAYQRFVAEQLKQCVYLDGSQTLSNLKSVSITYNGTNTITAASGVFVVGDVGKHIVYKTATGYESGRFLITGYTSATVVTVSVLQTPTTNTYASWYLTFSSIGGLSQYNGTTVGVVTDGGYLDDFLVSGGTITLDQQVTHAVVGYKYNGLIKSLCLGFQIGGENTQFTMKNINEFNVRCVTSAGGKVGDSRYRLENVQELQQGGLNYLPPLPIDGTKTVQFTGDNDKDKFFWVVQDQPLPFQVTCVGLRANYSVT